MTTMTSPLIEKIKKLLSLANSDNANERDLALAKANALAHEHSIDMALIDLTTVGVVQEEEMVNDDETAIEGSRKPVELKFLAWLLQKYFKVDIIWHTTWRGGQRVITVSFVGRKSDVALAKWLHSYLLAEMRRRWRDARLSEGFTLSAKNSFLYGMYLGMCVKLDAERSALEAEKFSPAPDLKARYTLAVVDETKKRKQAVSKFHGSIRVVRSTVRTSNGSAMSSGQAAGRNVSFARPLAA